LEGFRPNETVEIVSHRRDYMNNAWRGWGCFKADGKGRVSLEERAPLNGSYEETSPMGLFWSMEMIEARQGGDPERDITEPISVSLTARSVEEGVSAEITVRRHFTGSGVTDRRLSQEGLRGRLFLPADDGPHPAMIVLSGSSGGMDLPKAALLASQGYAALALGYFNLEGLPPTLDAIPLEYFAKAIAWLKRQSEVQEDFLGITGISRGGELSLLLGATFPEVNAVVAYVPSGVLHSGLKWSKDRGPGPAWTYKGEALPWLQQDNRCTDNGAVDWQATPVPLRPIFESSLRDAAAVSRATIPVERIGGPVLLISGRDDQIWPSTVFSEMVVARLQKHGHPYAVEHLAYEGAGHMIFPPFAPTTRRNSAHAVLKTNYLFGGSAEADAAACIDSWPKVLAFLEAAVARTQ